MLEISGGSAEAHSSLILSLKTDGPKDDAAIPTSSSPLGRMFSPCSFPFPWFSSVLSSVMVETVKERWLGVKLKGVTRI